MHMNARNPAVWFPAIKTNTGTDQFTERLAQGLQTRGIRCEITWLPLSAEYAPWTVKVPRPPAWANLVHVNSWLHSRFIPKTLPLIVTFHSCVHDPALEPYKSRLQRLYHRLWVKRLESRAISRASAITAVSQYTANRATAVFRSQGITPIPNGVDTKVFSPNDSTTPHSPFRLIFVGSLSRRKGADLLPVIMRTLGDDFELRYTGEVRSFEAHGDIPSNMIPLGRLNGSEALVAAYRDCDALLFPTRLEGFGLVAAEAMACGLPVVTSNNTALPEVVIDKKTGFLCATDDVEEFVTAVRALRDNPTVWETMRENCLRHAGENLTEDNQVEKYLELYRSLLRH